MTHCKNIFLQCVIYFVRRNKTNTLMYTPNATQTVTA